MSILGKLQFWKKDSPDMVPLDPPSGYGQPFGQQDQFGQQGSSPDMFGQQNAFAPPDQPSQNFGSPFGSSAPSSNSNFAPSSGFGQQQFSSFNSPQQYPSGQQPQSYPQNQQPQSFAQNQAYQDRFSPEYPAGSDKMVDRNFEIISLKLDAIKSEMESINTRLKHIEMIAQGETGKKYW